MTHGPSQSGHSTTLASALPLSVAATEAPECELTALYLGLLLGCHTPPARTLAVPNLLWGPQSRTVTFPRSPSPQSVSHETRSPLSLVLVPTGPDGSLDTPHPTPYSLSCQVTLMPQSTERAPASVVACGGGRGVDKVRLTLSSL